MLNTQHRVAVSIPLSVIVSILPLYLLYLRYIEIAWKRWEIDRECLWASKSETERERETKEREEEERERER